MRLYEPVHGGGSPWDLEAAVALGWDASNDVNHQEDLWRGSVALCNGSGSHFHVIAVEEFDKLRDVRFRC